MYLFRSPCLVWVVSGIPELRYGLLPSEAEDQVVLQLKSAYRDGTTHIVMSALEFMRRLAALVPRPRLHLIRFHGVLATNARLGSAVLPVRTPVQNATTTEDRLR
jgi:Putative transposase